MELQVRALTRLVTLENLKNWIVDQHLDVSASPLVYALNIHHSDHHKFDESSQDILDQGAPIFLGATIEHIYVKMIDWVSTLRWADGSTVNLIDYYENIDNILYAHSPLTLVSPGVYAFQGEIIGVNPSSTIKNNLYKFIVDHGIRFYGFDGKLDSNQAIFYVSKLRSL